MVKKLALREIEGILEMWEFKYESKKLLQIYQRI